MIARERVPRVSERRVKGSRTFFLPYLPHVLALASPEADLDLETRSLAPLRAAFDRLQQQGGVDPTLTFSSLLSDSPRSQHDLSEGVHEKQRAALLSRCSTDAEAADRRSCGGQYAGLWLSTSLRSYYTQARGSLFSIALRVRPCWARPSRGARLTMPSSPRPHARVPSS